MFCPRNTCYLAIRGQDISRRRNAFTNNPKIASDQTGLLQGLECTVLADCFQGTGTELYSHKTSKFRYPDPFRFQIRGEQPGRVGGHVLTNAPFFLGHPAPMNHVTLRRFGACDTAFSSHNKFSWWRARKIPTFVAIVKAKIRPRTRLSLFWRTANLNIAASRAIADLCYGCT